MAWLRRIRDRSRRERIRNEKKREELGAEETVIEKIKRRRLTWFGHVERMEGKRLPNAALRGERSRGRQRKRWMNNVIEQVSSISSPWAKSGPRRPNQLFGLQRSGKMLKKFITFSLRSIFKQN